MKRVGGLMPLVYDIENFLDAYYKACQGKRDRESVKSFSADLFTNLSRLRESFIAEEYVFGKYHYFTIYDPKCRTICAAPFEERIIHHALINVCKPYFERNLIYDTYATREGKGIYKALEKAMLSMNRYAFVAKMDVRKFFDSISHTCLMGRLKRLFKDKELLNVFSGIIDSYNTDSGCGVPIGNLTSQYFANQYLSGLDHYVKEVLKAPVYIRYMDDMLVFGTSRQEVRCYVESMRDYLNDRLSLELKPVVLESTVRGVAFLGYHVSRHKILLSRRSKIRFKRKYKYCTRLLCENIYTESEYQKHILPLIAFTKKAYTAGFRKSVLEKYS